MRHLWYSHTAAGRYSFNSDSPRHLPPLFSSAKWLPLKRLMQCSSCSRPGTANRSMGLLVIDLITHLTPYVAYAAHRSLGGTEVTHSDVGRRISLRYPRHKKRSRRVAYGADHHTWLFGKTYLSVFYVDILTIMQRNLSCK